MTKPRLKPKNPTKAAAEKRARSFEAVGLQGESASLINNANVTPEQAERATAQNRGNIERARRMDAFDALKDSLHPGAYDAAKALQVSILTARGEHDRGRQMERFDGELAKRDRTDAMIAARKEVNALFNRIGDRDAMLLSELIDPSSATRAAERHTWRQIVAYVTGEDNLHAQAAAVRAACANLLMAKNKMMCAA